MIWLKGVILGASLFAIGVFVFLIAALRMRGPLFAGPGQAFSIDVRTIAFMTTQNLWFWIAGVACIAIGLAVAVSFAWGILPRRLDSRGARGCHPGDRARNLFGACTKTPILL